MGFIITSTVTLSNGLTATGAQMTIGGAYSISKLKSSIGDPVKYCITYSWKLYIVENDPIQQGNDCLVLDSVDGISIYTAIYTALKEKYPGAVFNDN